MKRKSKRPGLFEDVYRDRTVLVTGHTGFKGAWLTLWLEQLGARVVGYALEPPTSPSLFEELIIDRDIDHNIGDVRDFEELLSLMKKHEPEFVFHLAAQSLVRRGYEEPRLTYGTNVMGTVNLLDAVRNTPSVRVCVCVSSDKCYENREWPYSYRENDRMGGRDPYSSSKGCMEIVAAAYRRSFFESKHENSDPASVVTVRAGNVIGGGDWSDDRLVPDCMKAFAKGEAVQIRYPAAVRPWQYVLEPLSAYLWIGSRLFKGRKNLDSSWNIGPSVEQELSVEEMVNLMADIWGGGRWEDKTVSDRMHEATILRLDCTKVATQLDWSPCYDLKKSIKKTVEWYYRYFNEPGFNAREHCIRDIDEYSHGAKSKALAWACGDR